MLEIWLLIRLCKRIGEIVRGKGRMAGGYQALTVLLWIGGEITGFVFGFSADLGNGAYATGLLGAAGGALTAYLIASSVKPLVPDAGPIGQVFE
jgi:hypothetical protein